MNECIAKTTTVNMKRLFSINYMKNKLADKVKLTHIKQQIIGFLSKGYSAKMIARELGRSPRTIEMHIDHMYRACNIHSKAEFLILIHSNHYKQYFTC